MEMLSTGWPFNSYEPFVGVSSNPRIESSVDFPQPDGPEIEKYCPFLISRSMSARACVSTSSVKNTFVIPFKRMTASLIFNLSLLVLQCDNRVCSRSPARWNIAGQKHNAG